MIITLLSTFGLILALIVMIMNAVVASRIETINIQGQVCILLNSIRGRIAYTDAIIAAVFTGIIIIIFISAIIIDIMHEVKQENSQNTSLNYRKNQLQQAGIV